jgi:hypothetical protein
MSKFRVGCCEVKSVVQSQLSALVAIQLHFPPRLRPFECSSPTYFGCTVLKHPNDLQYIFIVLTHRVERP